MLRRDLDAAGVPFEDTAGRRLDFHSLRGTFATNLAMAGVSPKAAQELMRHSDINLTMRTYTQLSLIDVASDLNKLPSLPTGEPQTLRATGTDACALEPKTYALRKHRPASVTTKPDEGLQPVQVAGCTNGCTREPENDLGCTPAESATEPVDAELSKVIGAWPTLPEHLKAAVMALVATVQNSSR